MWNVKSDFDEEDEVHLEAAVVVNNELYVAQVWLLETFYRLFEITDFLKLAEQKSTK